MLADLPWGWYTRTHVPTVAARCVATGAGLHAATTRQFAVFTIELSFKMIIELSGHPPAPCKTHCLSL